MTPGVRTAMRPTAGAPGRAQAMQDDRRVAITISALDDVLVARISGDIDSGAAGRVYDALVACVEAAGVRLIVDLSAVRLATRAGVRGLIVAARLKRTARGQMRICGAEPPVETYLRSLGFDHLLKFDANVSASIVAMAAQSAGRSL